MRRVRGVAFLVGGILLALVFLDELLTHISDGVATLYFYMVLSAVGSVACFTSARADWRPARRTDLGSARIKRWRKSRAIVFSVVGTLLAAWTLIAVHNLSHFRNRAWVRTAPGYLHALLLLFPVVLGLAAVACFRSALSERRSPHRQPTAGSGLTRG
jgi:cobalamin synthase